MGCSTSGRIRSRSQKRRRQGSCGSRRRRSSRRSRRRRKCRKGKRTKNPFLNYLRVFRSKHCGWPQRKVAVEGAKCWCKMSVQERQKFYKQACSARKRKRKRRRRSRNCGGRGKRRRRSRQKSSCRKRCPK